jgi:ATP-dependent helicase/nuclease subunit B
MPVRFIIGRAGSGKTRHCFQRIARMLADQPLGPPIFWLLPKQATFQAERKLTCRLGGFTRVRVVSFDQIGKDILTDCGDVGIPQVTPLGRLMVVGHLLRTHQKQLKFYAASARHPGLAAELDSTFGEFERAGFDAPALDDLLHHMDPVEGFSATLRDKLHDVHLLLTAYNAYIGQDRLDPQRRLQRILQQVSRCRLLKDATVFVDDFFDFTEYERKLLVAIAASSTQTEIALLFDPDSPLIANPAAVLDDLSPFHRTERTYQALHQALGKAGVKIDSPMLLREVRRFSSAPLASIERSLFRQGESEDGGLRMEDGNEAHPPSSIPHPPSSHVAPPLRFLTAPDARTEVDAAARTIHQSLRDGLRLRDVAVLARNINDYQELIDASFAEHDLPYFVDRRRTAAHHPLLQLVRSSLLIARSNWPHEAVMMLLKTGLAGVSEAEADELENYVLRHRLRGNAWESAAPWGYRRELIVGDDADPLPAALTNTSVVDNARRRVVGMLSPFIEALRSSSHLSTKQFVTQLFQLLERLDVRTTLSKWMREAEQAGQFEQRGEHEQVWAELIELFEHMVDLLGDQQLTTAEFLEMLDNGLESFDLALTPPTVDQVLVGQIDRTRTPAVKLVIVLGLNEGQFPLLEREDCVLSDADRRMLRKRQIDLDPETERKLLDERLLAYVAFTRASQQLVVSRCLADDAGRPRHPSIFWSELLRLFPDAPIENVPRSSHGTIESIGTPRQLVTSLMRWARAGGAAEAAGKTKMEDGGSGIAQSTSGHLPSSIFHPPSSSASDPRPALYQWLATHACCDDAIDVMRFRAWKALSYSNQASLSAETAARLFPLPLQATAAQLETFAQCPFKHFVRYGLNLQPREEPDVTGLDLSNAYHRILENLIGDVLEKRQDWCELSAAEKREMIQLHTAEIGRTLRNELMLSTARNRYLLERIEQNLALAIESQCEMHRRGKYRPAYAGLKFGGANCKLPAHQITTPTGATLQLRGQIDRVDLHRKGGAFTVSDYKLGAGPLSLDRVYHGLSLQLLTYLLVIQANGEALAGRKLTPAAAFVLQLLRSPQAIDHPDEAMAPDHPDFHLQVKPRGIIDARAVDSLDNGAQGGRSSVISVYVKKDNTLGFRQTTDTAEPSEFNAILRHVEKRLGELADQIIAGKIGVQPYWINRKTPCPNCEFRSICRFEPTINKYNILPGIKRDEVLKMLTSGGRDGR